MLFGEATMKFHRVKIATVDKSSVKRTSRFVFHLSRRISLLFLLLFLQFFPNLIFNTRELYLCQQS